MNKLVQCPNYCTSTVPKLDKLSNVYTEGAAKSVQIFLTIREGDIYLAFIIIN